LVIPFLRVMFVLIIWADVMMMLSFIFLLLAKNFSYIFLIAGWSLNLRPFSSTYSALSVQNAATALASPLLNAAMNFWACFFLSGVGSVVCCLILVMRADLDWFVFVGWNSVCRSNLLSA